ncbi:hypothetical protein ACFL3E_02155 [Patescibacteria group bacterium]
MEKEIGKIIHYYDKAGVGVLELSDSLAAGDAIKIKKGEQEFEQTVESMQVDHENVETAKSGDVVGLKLNGKTKEGAIVYKIE